MRRAFTLTEMMIAVAILVVVIVVVSRIFGTVSKVTGLGTAAADVLQEAAAIERQLRADLEKMTAEGFLGIRCVALQNDINVPAGGPLLNPALPPTAWVRADQLVFFTNGVNTIQTFRQGSGGIRKAQGSLARIYYGHAFQVPQGPPAEPGASNVLAIDPEVDLANPLVPWYLGPYDFVRTRFEDSVGGGNDYQIQSTYGTLDATQPPARRWILARQPIVLADDGGSPAVHLENFWEQEGGARSAFTVADPVVRNGRVDLAATQLNDLRRFLTAAPQGGTTVERPWLQPSFSDTLGDPDQRTIIGNQLLFYPRAERVAPSMHRVDQALTSHVLGTACSSFAIDWTYEHDTGAIVNDAGTFFGGIQIDGLMEHPWFGLDPANERGVGTVREWMVGNNLTVPNEPLYPRNIEGSFQPDQQDGPLLVYEAFFGFNRDRALREDAIGPDLPDFALYYTPWPSAIRITMTLHDTQTRLEAGREFQFVIQLPRSVAARPRVSREG